jgi:hypothetical protein
MHLAAETIELLEIHDQRRPLVGIDPIGMTFDEQIRMDVNALDAHLDQADKAAQLVAIFADAVDCHDGSFELDRTFERARPRPYRIRYSSFQRVRICRARRHSPMFV